MNKLLLSLLFTLPTFAHSADYFQKAQCASQGRLAKGALEQRFNDNPKEETLALRQELRIVGRVELTGKEVADMVDDAYYLSKPKSEEEKEMMMNNFGEIYENKCLSKL